MGWAWRECVRATLRPRDAISTSQPNFLPVERGAISPVPSEKAMQLSARIDMIHATKIHKSYASLIKLMNLTVKKIWKNINQCNQRWLIIDVPRDRNGRALNGAIQSNDSITGDPYEFSTLVTFTRYSGRYVAVRFCKFIYFLDIQRKLINHQLIRLDGISFFFNTTFFFREDFRAYYWIERWDRILVRGVRMTFFQLWCCQ